MGNERLATAMINGVAPSGCSAFPHAREVTRLGMRYKLKSIGPKIHSRTLMHLRKACALIRISAALKSVAPDPPIQIENRADWELVCKKSRFINHKQERAENANQDPHKYLR